MKVIMIGSHLRVTGGITRVVKNYLESGLPQKVNFEYFPTYHGSNHFLNIFYYFYQFFKLFIRLYILNEQYNVAHIHMSYRGSFVRKRFIINLLKKKKIPVILHMHGSQFKDFYNESSNSRKKQIKETLNKVTVILALGEQWKKYYKSISNTNVVSLDNAVFPKQLTNSPEEKIYVTTMGVLSKRKGTYDLIEAVSKIKGKIDSKYKFIIAGDGEIEKAKTKIKELELDDMFVIPGWISDQEKIDEIYRKSIIYVLPSYNEGMPMSILEAMSYGLPIVSTDIGSIPSVVNEENGIIIKPGDIEALSKSIIQLLNNNNKLKKIRRNNSEKVKLKYNIYNSVDELNELYKKVAINN
ncbi:MULTISPECIES: glycosyltransferase family 4 protein [Metabacillus]|uniref:Glycosyl transferase n=2 Tax=Metabacillus TaxID=2675233 RepID=A0A179T3C6_9BACI|nr:MULTISPECIES: glycosyltransferase family 4 protein [Metabacillus]OAS88184.1 glycosyl transferase [Metabacillus litoralis]QNF27385.1 glycosyltransferase family 4 protein [Metabacillus sp. KUDC1714]